MFFFYFFEEEVIELIENSLTGDETIEGGELQLEYAYDFYLPNGCKSLGFPEKTALLIKRRLVPGLYHISMSDAKNLIDQKGIGQYVIIYEDTPANDIHKHFPYIQGRVRLMSVDELIQKAGKRNIETTKDWRKERAKRLERAWKEIQLSPNTMFVGAGLSCSLGIPNWSGLLCELAKGLGMSTTDLEEVRDDSKNNYLLTARYIQNEVKEKKDGLVSVLRSILYAKREHSYKLIDAVTGLLMNRVFEEVITYNYDNYLEDALGKLGKKCQSIDCQNRRIKNYYPVLHVHGVVHPEDNSFDKNVVLSEDVYHELYRDSYHWANVAQLYALTHTTCLFIGLSMTDPSLRRLLDIASKQGSGNIEHYAFLCRDEYINHNKAEEIFSQMGVGIIWCENRDDVPIQIRRLYDTTSEN